MNNDLADGAIHTSNHLADQAKASAEAAIRSTQRIAQSAEDLARRSVDRMVQVSDRTSAAIQADPLKAVLIAAASGAVLMALVSLVAGMSGRGQSSR